MMTKDCAEERDKMRALIKGIESAIDENNPVKARELTQDLERVSFRWYMKTDTGERV